jgi:hypothetical protein
MPKHVRTIELFTCEYKCGHKADVEYKILDHEEKCYCNPENKSCRICANCSLKNGFMICNLKGFYYKVEKKKPDSDSKVYDKEMNVVWEVKPFPERAYTRFDWDEWNAIEEHNKNRPFPTTKCKDFKLGKKLY